MRFTRRRYDLKDREGEVRIVKKFLWYPRSFNTNEWRWLETATIKEEVMKVDVGGHDEWGCYVWKWIETTFHDL